MNESLRDLLRQGADTVERPQLDVSDLAAQTQRRLVRRRLAAATASAAAVVLIAAGGFALQPDVNRLEPAPPAPSETPTPAAEWSPERIRDEGSPGDTQGTIPATESGLTTRLYRVCDGTRCDPGQREDLHVALEVIQDGRSVVFDLHYSLQPWVRAYDADSVLVQDSEQGLDQPVRYRLLHADGTAVQLQLVDNPASPVPGPGVVVIDDWSGWNAGMAGVEELYLVDDRAGTLRPLDAPADVRYWGPNVDEFLWGVTDDCRVFWATNGTFEEHQLDCSDGQDFTYGISADEFPSEWLQPGRMAVVEQSDGRREDQSFVHVSLDYGESWQRFPVGDGETTIDVLQQLG